MHKNIQKLIIILCMLVALSPSAVFAAAPAGGYEPGEILDPACAPGDTDCFVTPLIAQDEGVDLSGNVLKLNFVGSGVSSAISSGVVTVTIPGGSGGLTSLNGLTGGTQTFAVGTSGSDFNISSSGTAHTFNIPDASESARGLLTTGAQTIGGVKTFNSDVVMDQGIGGGIRLSNDVVGGEVGLYGASGNQILSSFNSGTSFYDYGNGVLRIDGLNEYVGIGSGFSVAPDARLDVSASGPNGAMKGKMGYNSPSSFAFGVYGEQDGGTAITGLSVWDDNTSTLYGVYSADGNARNYFAGSTGIGTSTPDASAILDISSTTQGLLAPRMTEAERDLIGTPAIGLMVYNTDTDTFNYYDGSAWSAIGGGTSLIGSTTTLGNETWLGNQAGNTTGSSVYTIFIGEGAGNDAQTADHAIFIGEDAGAGDSVDNTGGGSSILIGNNTSTGGFSNSIAIGQGATNTAANQLLIDDSYIYLSLRGINYELPTVDGSSGYVLTTDGTGVLSWQNVSGGGSPWLVNGSDTYYTDGSVGVGTNTPNTSAILDLSSTTLGFLTPRMTEAQRDAIGTPATGLMVYNTDTDAFNYYDGSAWSAIGGGTGLVLFNENYVDTTPLVATGSNAMVIGGYSTGAGFNGSNTGAAGNNSVAIGLNALANADYAIAISTGSDDGSGQAQASGIASIAIGSGVASGTKAVSLLNGTASGSSSFSVGDGTASGNHSTSLDGTLAAGANSIAIGDGAYTRANGEISLGDGSDYTPDGNNDRVFNIGDEGFDLFTVSKLYGNIGIRNMTPNASAALDIASTSRGLLLPRMTEAQRDAIGTPATGLMVYNTDTDAFNYYDGSAWGPITAGAGSGITSLNSLSGPTQTLATGTSGTDFAISSSGSTHTFNIPTASSSARGLLSSTDWSTFNNKYNIPSQTGNSGKYLTTDGSTTSWVTLSGSGITSINSLSDATQTLATGTSGTDFAISSSGSTHTFNIPDAGSSARGLITTGTQTIAGAKTFSGSTTFTGNITQSGSTTLTTGTGLFTASGNAVFNGNTTFGDASADGITLNAGTMTVANDLAITISGGVNGINFDNNTLSIDAANNYVGVGTSSPITQLHVAGQAPASTGASYTTGSFPVRGVVVGKYMYIVNSTSNTLRIADISNPAAPSTVGTVSTSGSPSFVAVKGKYAYVAAGAGNFDIIDVSNPASPTLTSTVAISGAQGLAVQGNYAYVTSTNLDTVSAIDISNPVSPSILNTVSITNPFRLVTAGKYLYVATNDGTSDTFNVVDISNPASLSITASITSAATTSLAVQGNYAYLAQPGTNTLQIINISDPTNPTSITSFSITTPVSVSVSGRYAYVNSSTSVRRVNISDPASPTLVDSTAIGATMNDIFVEGRYLYALTTSSNLQIYDIGGGYVQQFESGNIETSSLTVQNNINAMSGNFTGGLNIGSTLSVFGGASVYSVNTTTDIFDIIGNSITSGGLLHLQSTSTGATGNTQTGLKVSLSGANANSSQTTFGGTISNTHTGTSSTNIGLSLTASGGTNNYALRLATNTSCTGTNALQTDASGNVACGSTVSDERVKNVGADYTMNALDQINGLTIKHFTYKSVEEGGNPFADDGGKEHIGFIAQNVEDMIPWGVHTVDFDGNTDPILALDPIAIQAVTVKALQDITFKLIDIENLAPLSLEPIQEGDDFGVKFFKQLAQKIATWLSDDLNGIQKIRANKFEATSQICIDNECFTAEDIQALKALIPGGGSVSDEEPTSDPETPPVDEGADDVPTDESGDTSFDTFAPETSPTDEGTTPPDTGSDDAPTSDPAPVE